MRPFGPFGGPKVHRFCATCGASRFATAQAEGGFMISAALPDTSILLFEASSQANTSGGRNGTSFLNHSRTCLVSSHLPVTSLCSLTIVARCEANTPQTQSTESELGPSP